MLSGWIGGGKRAIANALLVVLSLAIGLAALEAGGRLFATAIAKKGKLFRPDLELGWTPLPDLDLVRSNANGDPWHIVTDAAGIRGHPRAIRVAGRWPYPASGPWRLVRVRRGGRSRGSLRHARSGRGSEPRRRESGRHGVWSRSTVDPGPTLEADLAAG
jgi:hypothetical protein